MAYRRRKKSRGTRGLRCVRKKRVRVRGQGMALRCVKYGSGRRKKVGSKRRSSKKRRYAGTTRRSKRGARRYRPRAGGQKMHGPFTMGGFFYS